MNEMKKETDSLKDEFAAEVREHLESVEKELMQLENQSANPDTELISRIFRRIHSIKGASGFMGFIRIGELTHIMETLLQLMRKGDILPEQEYIDALLTGTDILKSMADDPGSSNNVDILQILARLTSLIESAGTREMREKMNTAVKFTNREGEDPGFEVTEFNLDQLSSRYDSLYLLKYDFHEIEKGESIRMIPLIRRLLEEGEIIDTRILAGADNFDQDLSGLSLMCHVLYATRLEFPEVERISGLGKDDIEGIVREKLAPPVPQEAASDHQPVSAGEEICEEEGGWDREITGFTAGQESRNHPDTVRIRVEILDQLMKLAGEMVLVRNNLTAKTESDPAYQKISQHMNIVTTELQETVMQTRMQPIGNLFSKLSRIVRDLSVKLHKKINFITQGDEVELDKTILEALTDPLVHLIRNCCDHGVEQSHVRKGMGKPAEGRIEADAWHEAGQINILIKDDGKGIHPGEIRKIAAGAGLKKEEDLARMSDREILNLVFQPGFSTAESISRVSGRGVGMDVVKTGIERIGGSIEIGSAPDSGTRVHLKIPLTLAIIPCMIVRSGEERYAIPQINLKELLCLYKKDIYTKIECTGDQEVFRLRNRLLPIARLDEILKRPAPFSEAVRREISEKNSRIAQGVLDGQALPEQMLNFAVVKMGTSYFGLVVDRIIGVEEVVVNPVHPLLKSLDIYAGTTIMGDGAVALILDIEGIARHAAVRFNPGKEDADEKSGAEDDRQTVLLFKNGPVEPFALPLPMIRRVEHIRTEKIERVGEREFITIDGVSTLVVRLENHLDVSPAPKQDEMLLLLPKHINRPFGILASEVIDTTETGLDLNTESYQACGLLGTSVIRERMTLFIDLYGLIELAEPDWFAERKKASPPSEKKTRILLVEDTAFFRHLVAGYLEADGYRVIAKENGREAVDALEENEIDIIVSDLDMPVMDGWRFMEYIRRESRVPDIPAIALTALDTEEDRARALEAGFNAYEVKLDREALLVNVSQLLRRS